MPLSAVSTTLDVYALCSYMVRLVLWLWLLFLSMWLISDLSSSTSLGEFGASFVHHCDIKLLGGFFGTMVKFGPLVNKDSCAGVRGVLERLMIQFCLLSELMHVCLDPLGVLLGATEGVVGAKGVGAEGAGAMGTAGVEELLLAWDLILELLGQMHECPLKVTLAVLMSKFSDPL